MRAFGVDETRSMFSGYIVMATAKKASATFSRPRHAQLHRRKSEVGSKITQVGIKKLLRLRERFMLYFTFSSLKYAFMTLQLSCNIQGVSHAGEMLQ